MSYIGASLRREVAERANHCCEYCLVHSEDRLMPYEIDHMIAEKHGGNSLAENLGWSCYLCNGYKGSDLGSMDWDGSGKLTPLFNPRQQTWQDHFRLNTQTAEIEPLTGEGRVTVFLLRLNLEEHLLSRQFLIRLKRYPR